MSLSTDLMQNFHTGNTIPSAGHGEETTADYGNPPAYF
jgi:hypothetical protein